MGPTYGTAAHVNRLTGWQPPSPNPDKTEITAQSAQRQNGYKSYSMCSAWVNGTGFQTWEGFICCREVTCSTWEKRFSVEFTTPCLASLEQSFKTFQPSTTGIPIPGKKPLSCLSLELGKRGCCAQYFSVDFKYVWNAGLLTWWQACAYVTCLTCWPEHFNTSKDTFSL